MSHHSDNWQIWIDTGGTFTDCLAVDPNGELHTAKVLSSGALRGIIQKKIDDTHFRIAEKWSAPDDFICGFSFSLLGQTHTEYNVVGYDAKRAIITLDKPHLAELLPNQAFEVHSPEEAPILAARLVSNTTINNPLPPMSMRLATTLGTNALLEKKGAKVALFITKGFGDLLLIGNQQRSDLFALNIQKPKPLYQEVVEVPERLSADGSILEPLLLKNLEAELNELVNAGITAAAIVFMHGYRNPVHEKQIAQFLIDFGFQHVSCSSEKAPFIRMVPRCQTTVVDAYLTPIINRYIEKVKQSITAGKLHLMNSAGGLINADFYQAKDSLLSGPAGGVVGSATAARLSGFEKSIGFDMGGTSTDVSRFDGDYDYIFEHKVGDALLVASALSIETVAAGGGSICWFDGTNLRVGPQSGGANPGPACYGAGGPLTLTDVNLLLGRLSEDRFEIPLDVSASENRLDKLIGEIPSNIKSEKYTILQGFLDIANERMADAIRKISIRKGYDPGEYVLVAFGGAGAQHACAVAHLLGIQTIIVPSNASLLSAIGLGHAVIERFAERQILQPLNKLSKSIPDWIDELSVEAVKFVLQEGISQDDIEVRRCMVNMRFLGQDAALSVEYNPGMDIASEFETEYKTIYGHWPSGRSIEIESIRVVASSKEEKFESTETSIKHDQVPAGKKRIYLDGHWVEVDVFDRNKLKFGAKVQGPSLIFEAHTAILIEKGWQGVTDQTGAFVIRIDRKEIIKRDFSISEAVNLELFTNRFYAIAEEMGELLQRTAFSTNIKERLDFSCTLLDRNGELVVNAPHMPVHLGAMGICVRRLMKEIRMEPGDVIITNHPGYGGSHLPDITLVTPAYSTDNKLIGYVANRAHHAEIGGIRPGSMPPNASKLVEEGVVFTPYHLVERGKANWEAIRKVFTDSVYPSRAVEENLADLNAAIASNHRGVLALQNMAEQYGLETITQYMDALMDKAEIEIRRALKKIPDGDYQAEEHLDDGALLKVRIQINGDTARFDFSGTSTQHPGNLNATSAIVNSAVIYVLRLLLEEPLPLNEGLLKPVSLIIPDGILNPHFPQDATIAPAVVGGNVETSQRLVDTLLKALGVVSCSQGTMNNLLFGTDEFGYYETVCGGSGAGKSFHGASAVHTHMTNTRITDPEIIEHRYPVRVNQFAIRRNSGGPGKYRGGNGIVREFAFLQDMELSILSQHRKEAPYGLQGGGPGKTGKQTIYRNDGDVEELGSVDGTHIKVGDRLVLETPGGGGFGKGV